MRSSHAHSVDEAREFHELFVIAANSYVFFHFSLLAWSADEGGIITAVDGMDVAVRVSELCVTTRIANQGGVMSREKPQEADRDKHPQDYMRDLGTDPMAGQNIGTSVAAST